MEKWKCEHCGIELINPVMPVRCCNGSEPSRGLGDTVAKITKAFGVKPCGKCKKRQQKLNKLIPYAKKDSES